MTLEELPDSTTEVAIGVLTEAVDVERAVNWAQDLMALGHLDDDTVALAVLDKTEWQQATRLLPKVGAIVGLDVDDPDALLRWIERHLLRNYLSGVLSEANLIDCGYAIWARLIVVDDHVTNPFDIYNNLGDLISIETGGRGLESLTTPDPRGWVVDKLAADGAFDRTGLQRP